MSSSLCEEIAKLHRKIQKIDKRKIVFLDETQLRVSEGPNKTLTVEDDDGIIEVEEDSAYAARYDMIACVNGERTFPPMIFTPEDRRKAGVQGINKKMLVLYIQQILAQAFEALELYPLYLILDKASIHPHDLLQEFHDMGCGALKDIWHVPTKAAKRMSPLDNALFHDWKQACRKKQ